MAIARRDFLRSSTLGIAGGLLATAPIAIPELGCDFFSAGTHKWVFGPGGTGMLWGNPRSQDRVTPIIPGSAEGPDALGLWPVVTPEPPDGPSGS